MDEAKALYRELYKLASVSEEVNLVKEALWKELGIGAGALGLPLIGYQIGKGADAEEESKRRNFAFLAGLGSGLVAPSILKGVGRLTGISLSPGAEEEFTSI